MKEWLLMNFKSFLIKTLIIYFVSAACITAVIAITGCIFYPDATFGYEAFLSPLIFAAISVLPTFVNYSKKELSFKQVIIRKIIHVILLEILILTALFYIGALEKSSAAISLALSIFIVFLTVNVVMWLNDLASAIEINKLLKELQKKSSENK